MPVKQNAGWKCQKCGYFQEEHFEKCPSCGYPYDKGKVYVSKSKPKFNEVMY